MGIYAHEHGVSAAGREFGTTRVTVRKWRKRYRHWGVDRLALHFNVSCSRSAAARILRQAGMTKRRKKKPPRNDLRAQKARTRPFEKLRGDTKDLSDIPAYRAYMEGLGPPRYLYSLRDVRTSMRKPRMAARRGVWALARFLRRKRLPGENEKNALAGCRLRPLVPKLQMPNALRSLDKAFFPFSPALATHGAQERAKAHIPGLLQDHARVSFILSGFPTWV